MENKRFNTRKLTGLALLTAIVVILQFLGAFIRFGPFSISLVLIPIVETHPHADFGDNGAVCGCRLVVHLDENRVVVDDGVIDGDVLHLFPFCGALSKMGSALVVVFWLPEVGLQRPL